MTTWVALGLLVLAEAAGNVCLARGMKRVGGGMPWPARSAGTLLRLVAKTPILGAGVSCMAIGFFAFVALLSRADLSVVVPATALGYALSTVGARVVLHEPVTPERWVGVALSGGGVALISLGAGAR